MTPEQYQRVREVFHGAWERPPGERTAFLDGACGGDAELRVQVESLLIEADQQSGFMTRSAVQVVGVLVGPEGGEAQDLPASIGRYRVVRLLGVGGMGAAYEAEQENPARRVAVKTIKPGLRTPSMFRRFAQEAQVLGRLRHPGIAQVYEAGVADGALGPVPFIAMELIAGVALDRWVRQQAPPRQHRIELMAQICDGVQHAHTSSVVHRDLKPGNILVEDRGQGGDGGDDAARGVTLLFGGITSSGSANDVWSWNGATWTQLTASASGPSRRDSFAMTYDVSRDQVVVFGGAGGNETWVMNMCDAPEITSQPAPQAVCAHEGAGFAVAAAGVGTLSYQWRKSGVNLVDEANHISGAQTPTLVFHNVLPADAGSYTCRISSICGAAISLSATLRVGGPSCAIDGSLLTQNRTVAASTSATALFCSPPDQDSGSQSASDFNSWSPNLHVSSSMCSATMNADVSQNSSITPTHVHAAGVAAYSHGTLPSGRNVSATGSSSFSYSLRLESLTSFNIAGSAGFASAPGLVNAAARVSIQGPSGTAFSFDGGLFTDFARSGFLPPGDYTVSAVASYTFANASINTPLSGDSHFDFNLQLSATDCNNNAVADYLDIADGFSTDCNTDGIPDECQHLNKPSFDGSTSLTFDGSSSFVEVPNTPSNNPESFTVELWVKYTGTVEDQHYHAPLTSRWSPTNFAVLTGYNFYRTWDNYWMFLTGDGAGSPWTALVGPQAQPNMWTHLAATYDDASATTRFYINGNEVASTIGPTYHPNENAPLRIGAGTTESDARYMFQGQIDDVRIWSYARSADDIARTMNERLAGTEPGLNTLYQLDEGSGSTVNDSAAAGGNPQGAAHAIPAWDLPIDCRCRADFNADGAVNSQDFFDFLGAFFGGSSAADFNGDDVVNSQDFFDFLAAFFTGC